MKSRNQKVSRAQEKRVAKEIGGREQFGSGAMAFAKGDVRVPGQYRIECKTTSDDVFTLKKETLDKIVREAQQALEVPVLQVDFQGPFGGSLAITLEEPQGEEAWRWLPYVLTTKSTRLHWAVYRLMTHGTAWYMAFQEKSGDKRWYRIELWQSFLDRVKEE